VGLPVGSAGVISKGYRDLLPAGIGR